MITVFGSINVDLTCQVVRAPSPGETVRGTDYSVAPGGKGANQALAARRAGAAVRLVGVIGTDIMARVALTKLQADGVDLSAVAKTEGKTGIAIVAVDQNGENTMVYAPGSNANATAAAIPPGAINRDDILLLQMEVPIAENIVAARNARRMGALVILSVAPFAPLSPEEVEPFSILIVNRQELVEFSRYLGLPEDKPENSIVALARRLDRTLITTLGSDGAIAAGDGEVIKAHALPVKPVDTTGAGDAFCGVLAAYLSAGSSFRTAMERAAIAGSLSCTGYGAQPSFPTRAQIEAAVNRYESGRPR